jgi:hypothetical protein
MRNFVSMLALATAALLCIGCSAERHVIGKWTTQPTIEQKAKGNPLAIAAASYAVLELDVRKDKTFTLKMLETNIDGTWTFEENVLALTITKAAGLEVSSVGSENKPLLGTLSEDKNRIELKTEQGPVSSALTFNRVED